MCFLVSQEALLIASPLASIIAALIGAGLGSLGSYYIHRSNLAYDKEQKEKDRDHQIKLALIKKIKTNNPQEMKDIIQSSTNELNLIIKLVDELDKTKENIDNANAN